MCPADVERDMLGESRDDAGVALGWGGRRAEDHRGSGKRRPTAPPALSPISAVQWHRQCPPRVSQSLACCPFHLLKSCPGLLTARLQPGLLQELPPQLPAAGRLYVGCKGEAEVGNAWEQAWTLVRLSQPSVSRFLSQLLLLGVAALWLHLVTLSFG